MAEPQTEVKVERDDVSVWSRHPVVSARGCCCCCSIVALGCLAVVAALIICGAAGLLVISAGISFLSNLLFGAA